LILTSSDATATRVVHPTPGVNESELTENISDNTARAAEEGRWVNAQYVEASGGMFL